MLSQRLTKLSAFRDPEWIANHYERVYSRDDTGVEPRVVAAVSGNQVELALDLAASLAEPLLLLWVLHTPRGGSRPGRYQSPPQTRDEVRHLLIEHRALFEQDGRGDVWIHSGTPASTIVLDRHDLLFGYGPIASFEDALRTMNFTEGGVAIPSPHAHEYHAELDDLERSLAGAIEWRITDLRPEDEQQPRPT